MGETGAGERILVVEPDNDIALVMELLLRDEGYATEVACNLSRATQLTGSPADLIILDVYGIPNLGASDIEVLLPAVSQKRVPVICVSTDTRRIAAVAGSPFVVGTLAMPFEADALLARVRAALAARVAGGQQMDPQAA